MTDTPPDPAPGALPPALAALAVPAPTGLADRVFADVVVADGPPAVGAVVVARTEAGIAFLRPGTDPDAWAGTIRERLRRPVRVRAVVPPDLADALRSGRAGGLRYDLRDRTQFERSVLEAALAIPPGETRPYAWVAASIGRPRAVRAVGSALARNPVPILIPCHRVVRGDGVVGRYLLGTGTKRALLAAEAAP